MIEKEGRECCRCKKFKDWDSFYPEKVGVMGHLSHCIECSGEESRRLYYRKPYSWVDRYLKRNYNGFTAAQYEEMLDSQGRVCAACGQPETAPVKRGKAKTRRLSVDFDYRSGKVEGLLCIRCLGEKRRGE